MKDKESIVYVNGDYLPRSEARIDPFDYGWRRGWVVYDTWVVWRGHFFKMDDHLERLWRSLRAAKIDFAMSKQEVKTRLIETVRRNGLREAIVWAYVSYGVPTESGYLLPPAKPSVLIVATPFFLLGGDEVREKGMRIIISSVRSLPSECVDPRLKHINRLNMNLAEVEAKAANADAPILLDINGYVTENNFANVCLIKDGTIYTPPEGVLGGITKETVFEIAQRVGIPASERRLTPYDLYNADEVFLSTSVNGIIPVVEISGRKIGDGKPGTLTQRLSKLYWQMLENKEYGTPIYT